MLIASHSTVAHYIDNWDVPARNVDFENKTKIDFCFMQWRGPVH